MLDLRLDVVSVGSLAERTVARGDTAVARRSRDGIRICLAFVKSTCASRHDSMRQLMQCWQAENSCTRLCLSHTASASASPCPPFIERLLGLDALILTPLINQTPSPRPYYALYHPLIPYQSSQRLCPQVSRKVSPAVRIQPLVHYPFSCSRILHLSQHMIRVARVRRSRNTSAVVQYIAPALPAREQNLVFELIA